MIARSFLLFLLLISPALAQAPAVIATAHVMPSGQSIAVVATDPAGNPVAFTAIGAPVPAYSVNGGAPVKLAAPALRWANLSYALISLPPTATAFLPTDKVTVTLPAGWGVTAKGPIQASTLRATNLVGGTILPKPEANPTMQVGYNHEGEQQAGTVPLHSNLAFRGALSGAVNGNAISYDAAGNPLKINQLWVKYSPIAIQPPVAGFGGKGLPGLPNGYYTAMWDWDGVRPASQVTLQSNGYGSEVPDVAQYRNVTGKAGNVMVFNLQGPPAKQWGPNVQVSYSGVSKDPTDGNYWVSIRNLRIYPPDPSDPTGMTPWVKFSAGAAPVEPPKYHPSNARMVGHVQWLRFLDPLNTNNHQVRDFSDFLPPSARAREGSPIRTTSNIVSIAPVPAGTDPYFSPRRAAIVQVTTATPHGLFTGQGSVSLASTGTLQFSGGGKQSMNGFSPMAVFVTGPTTFLMPVAPGNFNAPANFNQTMVNAIGAGGQVVSYRGTGIPIEEVVEICNQANDGNGCNLWWNAPFLGSADCHQQAAAYLAKNLKGKLLVEPGNEAWNFSFKLYGWCCNLSYKMTGDVTTDNWYQAGYVAQMKLIHGYYTAAFAAAGRPATDVVKAMGTQGAYSGGITKGLCQQVVAQFGAAAPTAVDLLATATYFDAATPSAGATAFDPLTVGQVLDATELQLKYGGLMASCVASHRPILDAAGMTGTKIGQYEGGFEYILPGYAPANGLERSWAVLNHPRMKAIQAGYLQMAQDAGSSISTFFFAAGRPGTARGQYIGWCHYNSFNQLAGTGDPVADAINLASPDRADQIKSQRGGAIEAWAKSVLKSPPPRPATQPPP